MIKFTLKSNLKNYDIKWAINKSLIQSTLLIQWKAVKNAPYQSWNLRRSITTEVKNDKWLVGTNVKYAKRVHFVNKKNPNRRLYLYKAINSSKEQIKKYFIKNINNTLNKK